MFLGPIARRLQNIRHRNFIFLFLLSFLTPIKVGLRGRLISPSNLSDFSEISYIKNQNTGFLNEICQILKSNFPIFKRSSAMLKMML